MVTAHDKARTAFQGKLDSLADGAALQLVPREFPGPVVIQRSVTLDGQGATIWALQGPVVTVAADNVVLRNFRIEVTGEGGDDPEEGCAILVEAPNGLTLENVEVRGSVIGLPEEEGVWRYPSSLALGQLAPGTEYECVLRIAVPVPCRVTSNISGVEVEPRKLAPGAQEVRLRIERLPADTLLNGTLSINTAALKRTVFVSGHILPTAAGNATAPASGSVVWEPPDWAAVVAGTAAPPPKPAPRSAPKSRL